jgi:hypothetical protein
MEAVVELAESARLGVFELPPVDARGVLRECGLIVISRVYLPSDVERTWRRQAWQAGGQEGWQARRRRLR